MEVLYGISEVPVIKSNLPAAAVNATACLFCSSTMENKQVSSWHHSGDI